MLADGAEMISGFDDGRACGVALDGPGTGKPGRPGFSFIELRGVVAHELEGGLAFEDRFMAGL